MDGLRDALSVLLDESRPIAERYDYALDRVHGMGRAIATAILLVVYPDQYGVWNTTAEAGIKALDLWPAFARGEPEGERYAKINALLVALAQGAGVDLWTLDALWWYALAAKDQPQGVEPDPIGMAAIATPIAAEALAGQHFGLERHLQDFLWDNWAQTDLADWQRYTEPGNDRAGYEHPCDVGRIDILAQHPQNGDWLVVELKRGQTSDETVGQVLRYMGWVKQHLAEEGETVHGLIVAQTGDDRIHYALSMVENVRFQVYQVQFTLQAAPQPEGMAQ